ncbi:hypothetical protein [Nocardia wallacei]|uniref:hypothetical protein n=1 Tax=Nocardia wallacei TaxID=480035 RepID=UPI002458FF74|nr:hypothetical protein [Nocardia wallacei]
MTFRCINAFAYGDRIVAGGVEVADDDPILASHAAHFVEVGQPAPAMRPSVEATTAAPGERRSLSTSGKPTAARKAPAKKPGAKKEEAATDDGGLDPGADTDQGDANKSEEANSDA